jgi:catechol 2,3-dioxygenase-like lactoylglutathione lyase family enzyme
MGGNQISGFGINVTDLDRSAEFYARGLGLQEKAKYDLGHLHEVLMGADGDVSILLVKHTARSEPPDIGTGYEKIVLACDDVAATYERAMAEGARSELEPRTIESMALTVAMVRDPDGYLIELVKHGG